MANYVLTNSRFFKQAKRTRHQSPTAPFYGSLQVRIKVTRGVKINVY